MAPLDFKQLMQNACEQLKNQFGKNCALFADQFHFTNFLQEIELRQSASPERCFVIRLPVPFSWPSFSKERDLSRAKELVSGLDGEFHPPVARSEATFDSLTKGSPGFDKSGNKDGSALHYLSSVAFQSEKEDQFIQYESGNQDSNIINVQISQKKLIDIDFGSGPSSKEMLGRATWIFLHTLAAQFPQNPTRQQRRDVKELMAILSRLYPCKECADHFKEVLKANPVEADSGAELAQWMCRVHNIVNRSLGKPTFPCQRVDARWGALDCDEGACNLQGRMH
ncbi:hypothetical protein KP509_34G018400 [Ceratopteris richardii]|uniref:Sulfhydryl oxidase n=1 Tax=Ceratopteris richardii TaxID=49495 RepID=A0A8T2QJ99_CERRI|nr:hypothetical protein KP509_34G018400 [Ceratopteris richardii]